MTRLTADSWGKSSIRVSKVHRGGDSDDFSEVTVRVALTGEVQAAYVGDDNAGVVPTDTIRNTAYALAQDHLTKDLEAFAQTLGTHFLAHDSVQSASVELSEHLWQRQTTSGFVGGSSERRTARLHVSADTEIVQGGIEGLTVLKTRDSAFTGFPRDEFTTLTETDDRILATTITAEWRYDTLPPDTSATWQTVRSRLCEGFFGGWSGSIQHQGWQMAEAVMDAVPQIAELSFRLPNQHHLSYDLSRFGIEDKGIVFQATTEPYGDIRFTVKR